MGCNSFSNEDRRQEGRATSDGDGRIEDEEIIPVLEERAEIGRRATEGRTVRVTARTVGEEVAISEPVTREEVTVERVPVGTAIDEIPEIREEGDLTVIPVVEERVKVVRELVLKEEIHLRRNSTTSTHEEQITLRKTQVEIDEDDPTTTG